VVGGNVNCHERRQSDEWKLEDGKTGVQRQEEGALLPGLRQQFEHVPDAGALPGSKAQRLGEDQGLRAALSRAARPGPTSRSKKEGAYVPVGVFTVSHRRG
jgi:hypothetical protein